MPSTVGIFLPFLGSTEHVQVQGAEKSQEEQNTGILRTQGRKHLEARPRAAGGNLREKQPESQSVLQKGNRLRSPGLWTGFCAFKMTRSWARCEEEEGWWSPSGPQPSVTYSPKGKWIVVGRVKCPEKCPCPHPQTLETRHLTRQKALYRRDYNKGRWDENSPLRYSGRVHLITWILKFGDPGVVRERALRQREETERCTTASFEDGGRAVSQGTEPDSGGWNCQDDPPETPPERNMALPHLDFSQNTCQIRIYRAMK